MSYNTRSTDFLLRMKRELKLDDTQMETLSKAYSESITKVKEEAKAEAKAELIAEEKAKARAKARSEEEAEFEARRKRLDEIKQIELDMRKVSFDTRYPKFDGIIFQEYLREAPILIKGKEDYIRVESFRVEPLSNGETYPFCQIYPFVFSRHEYENNGVLQIVGYTCDLGNFSDFKMEWHPMMNDFVKFYHGQFEFTLSRDLQKEKRRVIQKWEDLVDRSMDDEFTQEEINFMEEMEDWGCQFN